MESSWLPTRAVGQFAQRRPAVVFTILIALGIGVSEFLQVRPWIWVGSAAALLVAAIFIKAVSARLALLASATFLIGISAAQIERYQFPADSIWAFTSADERLAQVELAITDPPQLVIASAGEARGLPPKQSFVANIRAVKTWSGWDRASGKIAVTVEQPNVALRAGQSVRTVGMLARPTGAMNPGEFDYAAWCREQRILATFRVAHADGVAIVSDGGEGPIVWLRETARHLLALGFDQNQGFDLALVRAFVLGDSDPQLRDLDDKFVRTGTIHYLAISGLHVAIVGAMILVLFRVLRRSPRTGVSAALIAVALYGCVAEPSWPGWRSIILCAAGTMGILNRRTIDSLQLLAIAVGAVLLIHPADLTSGGFQVSFVAVLGLVLFTRPAEEKFWNWWRGPDQPTITQPGIAKILSRSVLKAAVSLLIASAIAWLMAMPLIAYHFGQINGYSVVAGIVMLPLTIVALAAGVGKILLTAAWPGGAHLWAMMATLPIEGMRHVIEWIDRLPGASVMISPPSLWAVVAYYAVFLLLFVPMKRRVLGWARGIAVAACAVLLLAPNVGAMHLATTITGPQQPDGSVTITFLSIGAGQCCVVRTPDGHADFVDDGSSTISDVGKEVAEPWMRAERCATVDRILLSHGDFDHISGTTEIFSAFNEPAVFTSPHFARHAVGNIPAEAMLHALATAGKPPAILRAGDRLDWGNGVSVDVLWPPTDCDMNSNNCGLVLKLKYAGRTVLFPADIQEPAERALLRHPEMLKADVLVAPHHGSAEGTTGEFIRAVAPRFIVASSYVKETHKQRIFDLVAEGYPLYRTSRCGAIDVKIDPSGQVEVKTFLGVGPVQKKN